MLNGRGGCIGTDNKDRMSAGSEAGRGQWLSSVVVVIGTLSVLLLCPLTEGPSPRSLRVDPGSNGSVLRAFKW